MSHLGRPCVYVEEGWFRDVDSNHDTQLQRLMSYRLDDPGIDFRIVAEPRTCLQTWEAVQFVATDCAGFA
jgi:hypothetical protein